jgi:hypothetical protein
MDNIRLRIKLTSVLQPESQLIAAIQLVSERSDSCSSARVSEYS